MASTGQLPKGTGEPVPEPEEGAAEEEFHDPDDTHEGAELTPKDDEEFHELHGQDDAMPTVDVFLSKLPSKASEVIDVLVKMIPPRGSKRAPTDICCVIDISQSMCAEATIKNANGVEESNGLSVLDIAKHGVKTVIKTLGPEDRLSVVWFNHRAEILLPLTVMDEEGQKLANERVDTLGPMGGTNIWEGLFQALESMRTASADDLARLGHVMLLTDGQSEMRDSILSNLKQYRATYERLPGTINTFGFGYNIDSELLVQLASEGDGTYSFIPDAGFVGTVFVNTMGNLLVTMAREAYLIFDAEEDCSVERVAGGLPVQKNGTQYRVRLGTLQYGQSRDVIFKMKLKNSFSMTAQLRYETADRQNGNKETPFVEKDKGKTARNPHEVGNQSNRSMFVETIQRCTKENGEMRNLEVKQRVLNECIEVVRASESSGHPYTNALLEDLQGQCCLAVSTSEYYGKWGFHYLPSIMFAHKTQQCNNFKDPSVQLYGGLLFKDTQEAADALFNTLPPPQPTSSRRGIGSWAGLGNLVSMSAYNDRYGVCIDATCPVQLEGGDLRPVGDLRKGDRVIGLGGKAAEVLCVVRTRCADGRALLVQLPGGARLTPYHPVLWENVWRFPAELALAEELPCEAVCSVALRDSQALDLGGVPCATLGHNISEGAAAHPYFGTERVITDLQRAPGFNAGFVEIQADNIVREPETGLVCKFHFD